jgi:hypothetical protein
MTYLPIPLTANQQADAAAMESANQIMRSFGLAKY